MPEPVMPEQPAMTETVRHERIRSWIMFGIALSLAIMFLCIWALYAGSHTYPRYQQAPAGAAVTVQGRTYKLVKMVRTDVVVDGTQIHHAQAGTVYVIAELDLTIPTRKGFVGCEITLLGDGRRTWESNTDFFSRRLPQYCGDDRHPITPRKPWRFEQIFEVPAKFGDRLYGIAVDDPTSAAPVAVLTP